MESINHLRGRVHDRTRAALHLMSEKGASKWSASEQVSFDALVDDAEHAQALLDERLSRGSAIAQQYRQQREGLAIFLRKSRDAWTPEEAAKVRNTMSTTTASEGGNTLASLVAGDLCDTLKGYGWMRQVADDMTTTNGADLGYPTSDGTSETGELVAQNIAAALLDPSFGTRSLNTSKFGSKVFTVPIELLQDAAIDVVGLVFQRARDRIGRVQNTKFTIGSGSGEPTGLVTAASVGKAGTTGQTLTIIYDDLVDLIDSVDEASLGMPDKQIGMPLTAPGWMFSQTMRKVVRKVKDTNGRPIWLPAAGGALPQLLDYPVYINNDVPVPAANAKSLAFGNLHRYMIRDALAAGLYRFNDSAFTSKGQVGFLAWVRAGGNLLDTSAVKLYQHSAS